jgi:hypothetical protein
MTVHFWKLQEGDTFLVGSVSYIKTAIRRHKEGYVLSNAKREDHQGEVVFLGSDAVIPQSPWGELPEAEVRNELFEATRRRLGS